MWGAAKLECLHPRCPMGEGARNWGEVINHPHLNAPEREKTELLSRLENIAGEFGTEHNLPTTNRALLHRLLVLCPCLYSELSVRVSAQGVVHLCEITLGQRITSENVCRAFDVQHPGKPEIDYQYAPLTPGAGGGDIMEALCGEVLNNEGIPHMVLDENGWPEWRAPAHVSLNKGKFSKIKLYGDILIPAAPTNILISVKSEAARERLLLSGNRFESIGFGFFNDPTEFWSANRIKLYKRMGFTAIYMPRETRDQIIEFLREQGQLDYAININGTSLYRDIEDFGREMRNVAGKLTLDL